MDIETMAHMCMMCKEFIKDFEKAEKLAMEYMQNEISKGADFDTLMADKHINEIYDAIASDSAARIVHDIVMNFIGSCLNEDAQEVILQDMHNELRRMEENDETSD